MANCKTNKTEENKVSLNFCGYDKNIAKATKFNDKVAEIKKKIEASIQKNINAINEKAELANSIRMLQDTDTHTVITLRCGAYKIFQNTTKKGEYSHIEILEKLKIMLNQGDFDKEITAYAKKSKKKTSKTAASKTSAE